MTRPRDDRPAGGLATDEGGRPVTDRGVPVTLDGPAAGDPTSPAAESPRPAKKAAKKAPAKKAARKRSGR